VRVVSVSVFVCMWSVCVCLCACGMSVRVSVCVCESVNLQFFQSGRAVAQRTNPSTVFRSFHKCTRLGLTEEPDKNKFNSLVFLSTEVFSKRRKTCAF